MMDIETALEGNGNRPDRIPSIPTIYLNTTDKAEICLHTPDNDNGFPFRRPYHVSLPDLSGSKIPHIITTSSTKSPLTENPNSPNSPNNREEKIVGVYCSPRSSRRGLDKFSESADAIANAGKNDNGFCWLNTFDPSRSVKRKQRNRHSSSSSSENTVKSASHISTCGSRSRLGHFDRLSLPEMSSLSSVHLRRVYSGPIGQMPVKNEDDLSMPPKREVKSCSNLSSYDKYATNFFAQGSTTNLLSPPSVLPSMYVNHGSTPSLDDIPTNNTEGNVDVSDRKTFEQMYEEAYRRVHQHCLRESRHEKQQRIQQWLKNLSDGTCSAGQSHESNEG